MVVIVGHTKSGGSLLGAMLDAHPAAILGEEIDVLELCQAGFGPDQIFRVLERSASREAEAGRVTARRLGGYSLAMPGWQGMHDHATLAGVSRAGPTTRRLGGSDDSRRILRETFAGHRLALLHVVRRPHDSVAAMVLRSGRELGDAIADYAEQCRRLDLVRAEFPDLLAVRYESLVADPGPTMRNVVEFVGLDDLVPHVEACIELVDASLVPESARIEWTDDELSALSAIIERHDFLETYRT